MRVICLLIISSLSAMHGLEHLCGQAPAVNLTYAIRGRSLLRSANSNPYLRFIPLYTSDAARNLQNGVIKPALKFWSRTLRPTGAKGQKVLITRRCKNDKERRYRMTDGTFKSYCVDGCSSMSSCFNGNVPEKYLSACREIVDGKPVTTTPDGEGIGDTGMMIIIEAEVYEPCVQGAVAFATSCQIDPDTDRPVLGYINICPNVIDEYSTASAIKTVIHELGHALGFSPSMYAFMRDENGNPRTPRNSVTGKPENGMTSGGIYTASTNTLVVGTEQLESAKTTVTRQVSKLVTPALTRFAQQHYGCDAIDGVPLENVGGSGTSSAHFKTRFANYELMGGAVTNPSIISNLTLSYFQDSGWYKVDFSKAEVYRWAKNAGCLFVVPGCYKYISTRMEEGKPITPWCNNISSSSCKLVRYEEILPEEFQHFTSLPGVPKDKAGFYGGTSSLADFCPAISL